MQQRPQGADFKVSTDEIEAVQRDGYLIARGLFSEEETALIRETMEQDPIVRDSMFDRTDDSGAATQAVVWLEPGESTYGLVARIRRVANTMSALLGHEVYHYQAKLTAKEPRKGGGIVNLTTYRRNEAVVAVFRRQPLHAILPWRQI